MHIEWTEENIKFLKDHIHIKHKDILEAYFKTSRRTIKKYADKDGVLLKTPGWTKADEEFLKNNYDYKNKDLLIKKFNRSWRAIVAKAFDLNVVFVKEKGNIWSEQEIELIKKYYNAKDLGKLQTLLPNRDRDGIWHQAKRLGLSINSDQGKYYKCQNEVENLLQDTVEAFYWIGFLLADGHISHKNNSVNFALHKNDIDRIEEYANFVKGEVVYHNTRKTVSVQVADKHNVPKIIEKFDINQRKTYNPPNIENYNQFNTDLLTALIIGFIDGDGHITKAGRCIISVNESWHVVLKWMADLCNTKFNTRIKDPKISNRIGTYNKTVNICSLTINQNDCKQLKKFIEKHNLNVMKRKWDRVKSDGLSDHDLEIKIKTMLLNKHTYKEIEKELGCSTKRISKISHQLKSALDNPTTSQ